MTFAGECLHQLTTLIPVAGPCRHMQVTEQGHQEAVGREQLLYKGHALFHTDICGMDKSETKMRGLPCTLAALATSGSVPKRVTSRPGASW